MRKLILLLTYLCITAFADAQHHAEAGSQEIIKAVAIICGISIILKNFIEYFFDCYSKPVDD